MLGGWAAKRQPDLTQVMLIMSGDVVEFISQCAHAVYAVHKLKVATPLILPARIVDDRVAHGFVHTTGEVQGQPRIVESLRPRVLIHHPYHRTRLTERSTDAIEGDGLVIGEVMQDIRDGPFAWAVGAREVALVEREALQRLVSGSFELPNELRIDSSRLTDRA